MDEEIFEQILKEIININRITSKKLEQHEKRIQLIQKYQDTNTNEFYRAVAYYNENHGCFFNNLDSFLCISDGCASCNVVKGIEYYNHFLNTPLKTY